MFMMFVRQTLARVACMAASESVEYGRGWDWAAGELLRGTVPHVPSDGSAFALGVRSAAEAWGAMLAETAGMRHADDLRKRHDARWAELNRLAGAGA